MILSHISFALGLIALGVGGWLFIWSLRTEGAGVFLAKTLGILIMILAAIDLGCTAYSSVRYKNFPPAMMGSGMNMQGPMNNKDCCAMMQKNMNMPKKMPANSQPGSTPRGNAAMQNQSGKPAH